MVSKGDWKNDTVPQKSGKDNPSATASVAVMIPPTGIANEAFVNLSRRLLPFLETNGGRRMLSENVKLGGL